MELEVLASEVRSDASRGSCLASIAATQPEPIGIKYLTDLSTHDTRGVGWGTPASVPKVRLYNAVMPYALQRLDMARYGFSSRRV